MRLLMKPIAGFPLWVLVHLVIVIAATAAGAVAGASGRPDWLFPDFDGIEIEGTMRFLTDLWSSKNIAYLAAFAATLVLRSRAGLATLLGMKFVNDTLDQFWFGPQHLPESSLVANILPWLIMTLPMVIGAWQLWRLASTAGGESGS